MTESPELPQLLAAMYDCAIVPDLWPRVLPELASYMDSRTVLVFAHNRTTGKYPLLVEFGIEPERLDRFLTTDGPSPWPRVMAMLGVDEPTRIEDVFDVEEFRRTPNYKQLHLPYGVGGVLAAKVIDDVQRLARFHVTRSDPYGVQEVGRFRTLCPHIRRVISIMDLLEQRTLQRDSLAEVLNHLAAPVIMIDPKQRIVHTNTSAQEFLAEGKALSSVRGVLTASNPRNQEGLRRVTRALDLDAKSLALESDEGPLAVATVLPLTSGLRASHGRQLSASAAIFVHNKPSFDDGMVTTLAAAFGVTGAEARVLSALLEGLSLAETAARFQISVNTVRWHLKRLFEKTNTRRQGDLIRLASSAIPQIRVARDDKAEGKLH